MAGTYFEIIIPGYSVLWTRDLPYDNDSDPESPTNALNPDDAAALVEGEWLEMSGGYFVRGADGVGDAPAYPFFMERGRYDMQIARRAHCIVGPIGYLFTTKMADVDAAGQTAIAAGVSLVVKQVAMSGVDRRVLVGKTAVAAREYAVGYCTRVINATDNYIEARYEPHFTPAA